jgi:hypothetical protein
MAHLPPLPKDASLLDVFRMFPETNEPLLAFHETLLRGPCYRPLIEMMRMPQGTTGKSE